MAEENTITTYFDDDDALWEIENSLSEISVSLDHINKTLKDLPESIGHEIALALKEVNNG